MAHCDREKATVSETNTQGRTTSMRGRTVSMTALTASGHQPSRSAQAVRSLRQVDRITDPAERRKAFARHMERFPPTIARV